MIRISQIKLDLLESLLKASEVVLKVGYDGRMDL
jgi:hypothetical protein